MAVLDTSLSAIRRSTRLQMEIPVRITSLSNDISFSEQCYTTVINAHGCGVVSPRAVAKWTKVRLEIDSAKRHTTARVSEVVSLGGEPERWLLGLELEIPGNFWGIEYAPADWKVEEENLEENAPPVPPKPRAAARRWKLTDITRGACYLESTAPFAVGTAVIVSVRAAQTECVAEGIVRVSHPQTGMAVEFMQAQGLRQRVEELTTQLGSQREAPRVLVGRIETAHASHIQEPENDVAGSANGDGDDLLELVRLGASLTPAQFLESLEAQRLGRRQKPRIDIALPVLLTGKDIVGRPLDQRVTAVNISRQGALLTGIHGVLSQGDCILLARGTRKERFCVTWVADDEAGSKIGVAALDPETKFWADVLETASQPENTESHLLRDTDKSR